MKFIQTLLEQEDSMFPPLYHGTSSEQLIKSGKFSQEPIYLTDDEHDAAEYARGKHLGGAGGPANYVLTIATANGRALDGDDVIQQIIVDEHEQYESIDQFAADAKKQGYRYITMSHPSFDGEVDETLTVISLHPNEDLKIVGIDKA